MERWKVNISLINEKKLENTYNFITHCIFDNQERIFRWKLLHHILPNGILLHKWKIVTSPNCVKCNTEENYLHYFVLCKELETLWTLVRQFFSTIGYNTEMKSLENIVLGYKVEIEAHKEVNLLLSLIGYVIYKHYHKTERRRNYRNIFLILKTELKIRSKLIKYKEFKIFEQFAEYLDLN